MLMVVGMSGIVCLLRLLLGLVVSQGGGSLDVLKVSPWPRSDLSVKFDWVLGEVNALFNHRLGL